MITDIVIVRLNFLLGKQAKHDISIALVNDDGKREFDDFTWLVELFPPLLPFDGCQTPVSTKMVLGAKISTHGNTRKELQTDILPFLSGVVIQCR